MDINVFTNEIMCTFIFISVILMVEGKYTADARVGIGRELQEVSEPMLHRVGWRRTPLPAHCEFSLSLACIPARLLQPPLSLKHFGSAGDVPVPSFQTPGGRIQDQ